MDEQTYSFQAEQARFESRQMFQRMLSGWAMDVLSLRRQGLDVPSYRVPEEEQPFPFQMKDAA